MTANSKDNAFEILDIFGEALAKTRSQAISDRQESGIEEIWREDEEFYEGIDEANRTEHSQTYRQKPWGQAPARKSSSDSSSTQSTVFPNITRPYCDMAAARISDMLMPTDDRPFEIQPTPIPDLVELLDGNIPAHIQTEADNSAELSAIEANGGLVEGARPDQAVAEQYIADVKDEAQAISDQADAQAKRAQKRIDDWLTQGSYQSQNRRVIEDAARIGSGVLKGPVPEVKKITSFIQGQLVSKEIISPVSKRVDAWNLFPDGACGENIHNGSFIWERDYLSRKQLRELKIQEGYIEAQIDKCLTEGPQIATKEYKPTSEFEVSEKNRYEIWYYHGHVEREELIAAGVEMDEPQGEEIEEDIYLPAMIVMVNNHVIKAAIMPLDDGEFPYDVMVWQRRSGHWAGIGVARQIRTPQRIVTGAVRNLMDNAGMAAGPMLAFLAGVLAPGDGKLGAAPRKVFIVSEDAEHAGDVSKAITSIKVDMMVDELMEIVNLGLKLAEDVTGMPMLLQGQLGKAPDTVGGMEMLFNSASSVLRRLAKLYDDMITDPHINRYYNWLLQYGEDNEKGDYMIQARGSSALVERSIQSTELVQILNMANNPTYNIDPKKAAEEYLKSRHFNPKNFEFDDTKWQEIVTNLAQAQSQDSRLAVAEINNQVKQAIEQMRIDDKERQRQHEAAQNEIDRQYEAYANEVDGYLKKELKAMDAETKEVISLDRIEENLARIKGELTKNVMNIRAQAHLAKSDTKMPQIADAPIEPPERAEAGMAYQQ